MRLQLKLKAADFERLTGSNQKLLLLMWPFNNVGRQQPSQKQNVKFKLHTAINALPMLGGEAGVWLLTL